MVKSNISWCEYNSYVDFIVNNIQNDIKDTEGYDIVGLSRGGLILAASLAYKLDIKNIFSMGIRSYSDKKEQQDFYVYQSVNVPDLRKHIFIVDDISDTGDTFNYLLKYFYRLEPQMHITTVSLVTKNKTTHKPNYSSKEYEHDVWVEFPWD
jgi:hypoxanthine phosphoribosyltransferase